MARPPADYRMGGTTSPEQDELIHAELARPQAEHADLGLLDDNGTVGGER